MTKVYINGELIEPFNHEDILDDCVHYLPYVAQPADSLLRLPANARFRFLIDADIPAGTVLGTITMSGGGIREITTVRDMVAGEYIEIDWIEKGFIVTCNSGVFGQIDIDGFSHYKTVINGSVARPIDPMLHFNIVYNPLIDITLTETYSLDPRPNFYIDTSTGHLMYDDTVDYPNLRMDANGHIVYDA